MVSGCAIKLLGDLPFEIEYYSTCGTFMINRSSTILSCFSQYETNYCHSLTRKHEAALSEIQDFKIDTDFEIDRVLIPNSTYHHFGTKIANYRGFPLVLGGGNGDEVHNKLEMLDINENGTRWIQYEEADYPFSKKLVINLLINRLIF